jgi:ankyrin repeat protein
MNYYQKYLKYKQKYLNLLKGGIIPQIDCDLLPFEKTNINIIYQGRFILKNNNHNNNNYLLNNDYQFEKTQNQIKQQLFHILDLSMLANLNVKLGCEIIPFHVGSLQFNFNIIIGVIKYLKHYVDQLNKDNPLKDKVNHFIIYVSNKIFNIDINNNNFLGISNKNSILNCFSFFNKLQEFLNYLLLNEYKKQTIDELFPNIENIKDFYNIYSFFYDTKSKECAIKKNSQSSRDMFYNDISKFKDFINNCNVIDKQIEFKSMFGISLINLILINWIYLRSLRTNLVIGSLSSNLYPISKLNFLENIFQINETKIYSYAKQQKELNKVDDINKLLLEKIGVPIIPYGQSTYKDNIFPNCVENTLLQLLKILAWQDDKYNIYLLPEGISEDIKKIIERIDKEPLKVETKKIMDDFVVLVSNIKNIDYRDGDHNIVSNKQNVGNILNYVFNSETVCGGISNYNDQIFKKINDNTEEYSLEQKDDKIIIDKNNFKINIIIIDGHASIEDKIDTIYNLINTYEYLNILYTFNYTKDDSINFDYEFVNFCKKQNQDINNFLTNKIINIQKISLKIKNSKDEIGHTCLHIACILDNKVKLQEFIDKKKADINIVDNKGNSPLLIASIYGNFECIQLLIEKNSKIDTVNIFGNTPILEASENGHIECVKLLIEKGADVNYSNINTNTPLLEASKNGHIECVKLLIEKGADLNYSNINGISPLIASIYDHIECVKFLIDKGADVNHANKYGNTSLLIASSRGNNNCAKLLIEKGADLNYVNKEGSTPLLEAFKSNSIECIKLLIEKGANVKHSDNKNYTALWWASRYGDIYYVKFLLEKGIAIDYANTDRYTPLWIASRYGNIECVEFLLRNHAVVDYADTHGNTPLIISSRYGHIECVKLLIENGANVNYENNGDYTPLKYASKYGHIECVNLLKQYGAY